MTDIKVGDVVHVRGEVTCVPSPESAPYVSFAQGDTICIPRTSIVHVEPRPLAVGDKVRTPDSSDLWEVVAIRKDLAWIWLADSAEPTAQWVYHQNRLSRAP